MTEKSTDLQNVANYQTASLKEFGGESRFQSSAGTTDVRTVTTTRQFGTITVRVTTRPPKSR
jgi:hypothetical protein